MARENECESCHFDDPVGVLKVFKDGRPVRELWLCEICSGTMAGNAAFWPEQYEGSLLRAVAWIGNRIRKDLVEGKS